MRLAIAVASIVLIGVGCSDAFASADGKAGSDVVIDAGSTFAIEPWMPFWQTDPSSYRSVSVTSWNATSGDVALAWTESAATDATTPVIEGTITSNALLQSDHLSLPAFWQAGAQDVSSQSNGVLWLGQHAFSELTSSSETHIELGLFDSTIANTLEMADAVKNAVAAIQGRAQETGNTFDVTKVTKDDAVKTYRMRIDGTLYDVDVVTARNAFATYTILNNPTNPMVLQVTVRPWALGPSMFSSLQELKKVIGYKITSLSSPVDDGIDGESEAQTSSP